MSTLEELQALTDEQLVELCAVEVMGFTKNVRKVQGPRLVTTWLRDPGDFVNKAKKWDPLTDWNHTMEVVERMKRDGYSFTIHLIGTPLVVVGKTTSEVRRGTDVQRKVVVADATDQSAQRAICLAALLAVSPQTDAPQNT